MEGSAGKVPELSSARGDTEAPGSARLTLQQVLVKEGNRGRERCPGDAQRRLSGLGAPSVVLGGDEATQTGKQRVIQPHRPPQWGDWHCSATGTKGK